jgi:glycosyltransferase involved in cell wall biosynthesis
MKGIVRGIVRWVIRVIFGLVLCPCAHLLILFPALLIRRSYVPLRKESKPRRNRLGIVLALVPDVSHTFIYREAARLKEIFDCSLVACVRGDDEYWTPLTCSLAEGMSFMPSPGDGSQFARYYLCYLKQLLLHPLRVANIIRLYEPELGGRPMRFVDHRSVLDLQHPIHGFYLARLLEGKRVGHIHAYCTHFPTTFTLVAAHMLDISFSINSYVDFDFFTRFKMLEEKLRLCDFDVVHTHFCKERLLGYTSEAYRDKIHVIRFGLDLRRFIPRGPSGSTRLRLLCIGNLVPKKGHRILIKACEIVKREGFDVELLIIGAGPLRGRLEDLASFLGLSDRIRFTGGIPSDRVIDFLTPDAILVVPSVYAPDGERDGMPTVISEAMAMATPIVSTYVSGIPEVITDHHNGLLVQSEDYRALAGAIIELASDEGLRKRLVENGRTTAREFFDESRLVPQVADLLRRSLAGEGSAPAAMEGELRTSTE